MKTILILILLICISCADNKKSGKLLSTCYNEKLYIVDLAKTPTEDRIKLSSLLNNVETIILETNEDCMIGEASTVKIIDSLIVVMDNKQTNSILVFDKNGKFRHKIGRPGLGPGEYVEITDSSIDFVKKEIYLYDFSSDRINIYDINTGIFRKSLSIDEKLSMAYCIQYVNDNKIYTSVTPHAETGDSYLLREIDAHSGKEIGAYLDATEYNRGWNRLYVRPEGFFYQNSRKTPKYVQMFMDTIVSIETDRRILPYLVVKSEKWISDKDIRKLEEAQSNNTSLFHEILYEKNIVYNINNFLEGNDFIYFRIWDNGDMKDIIVDKKTSRVRATNLLQDDIIYNGDRFLFTSFIYAEEDKIYSIMNMNRISLFLEIAYDDGVSLDLDKKEELMKLSEDSNPVIFCYNFR